MPTTSLSFLTSLIRAPPLSVLLSFVVLVIFGSFGLYPVKLALALPTNVNIESDNCPNDPRLFYDVYSSIFTFASPFKNDSACEMARGHVILHHSGSHKEVLELDVCCYENVIYFGGKEPISSSATLLKAWIRRGNDMDSLILSNQGFGSSELMKRAIDGTTGQDAYIGVAIGVSATAFLAGVVGITIYISRRNSKSENKSKDKGKEKSKPNTTGPMVTTVAASRTHPSVARVGGSGGKRGIGRTSSMPVKSGPSSASYVKRSHPTSNLGGSTNKLPTNQASPTNQNQSPIRLVVTEANSVDLKVATGTANELQKQSFTRSMEDLARDDDKVISEDEN